MSSTAFPIIQSTDPTLNRIQTNIQNTFAATQASASGYFVGQVLLSALTGQQFLAVMDTTWVPADGTTSIVGSDYTKLTNAIVAPLVQGNIIGVTAFIKVNE